MARYTKPSRAHRRSGQAHGFAPHRDQVAGVELATPACLRLAVHRHSALEQQRLGAAAGDPGQLEQLTKPDRVASNFDLLQGVDVARWTGLNSSVREALSTLLRERRLLLAPFNRGRLLSKEARVAEQVQIQGSQEPGKIRNPLGVIGLTLITLGIYGIVWYYKLNKELAEIGKGHGTDECGTNPTTSVLAITIGCFIIVPPFVSMYKTWVRLSAAERVIGTPEGMEPGLGFLLSILIGPVGTYILQSNMNKVLKHQVGGAAVEPVAVPAPA
jgi:hypothetical protein